MNKIVLKSLHLVNFATFENQHVDFGEKFNCIVGETGSGKSLILTAFLGLLGNRIDKKSIRKGAENAIIEGSFLASESLHQKLSEDGYPSEDATITIKRVISGTGTSKSFINGLVCSSNYLSNFIREFIDLVGQFENQKLLSSDYQLELLDLFCDNREILTTFQKVNSELKNLEDQAQVLSNRVLEQNERAEFLKFQIEEFNNLNLSVEEEIKLGHQREQAFNFEKNRNSLNELDFIFNEDERSLSSLLARSHKLVSSLKGVDINNATELLNAADSSIRALSELITDLSDEMKEDLDIDLIMSRIDQYAKIKRKYGLPINEIIEKVEQYKNELSEIDQLEPLLKDVQKSILDKSNECHKLAQILHRTRTEAAERLGGLVTKLLQQLNMIGAKFVIQVNQIDTFNQFGFSRVDFMAETNRGEGTHLIKEIASGGELSRILLCLRQIISRKDSISIFFFDEIDTGIGGDTAVKIGKLLSEISESSQVITITHLPQIANSCSHIIHVTKKTIEGEDGPRTLSSANMVSGSGRKHVIDEMIAIN